MVTASRTYAAPREHQSWRVAALNGCNAAIDLFSPSLFTLWKRCVVGEDEQFVHKVSLLLWRELADFLGQFLTRSFMDGEIARLLAQRTTPPRLPAIMRGDFARLGGTST